MFSTPWSCLLRSPYGLLLQQAPRRFAVFCAFALCACFSGLAHGESIPAKEDALDGVPVLLDKIPYGISLQELLRRTPGIRRNNSMEYYDQEKYILAGETWSVRYFNDSNDRITSIFLDATSFDLNRLGKVLQNLRDSGFVSFDFHPGAEFQDAPARKQAEVLFAEAQKEGETITCLFGDPVPPGVHFLREGCPDSFREILLFLSPEGKVTLRLERPCLDGRSRRAFTSPSCEGTETGTLPTGMFPEESHQRETDGETTATAAERATGLAWACWRKKLAAFDRIAVRLWQAEEEAMREKNPVMLARAALLRAELESANEQIKEAGKNIADAYAMLEPEAPEYE